MYGKQTVFEDYLDAIPFCNHSHQSSNFLFRKFHEFPSDCSYCPTKDQGPLTWLTLSFASFGAKFLVADLSSLGDKQAQRKERWLWGTPGLQSQSIIRGFHLFLQCALLLLLFLLS